MILSAQTVKKIKAIKEALKERKRSRKARNKLIEDIKDLNKLCSDYRIISENALDFSGSQKIVDKLRKKGYTIEYIKCCADYGVIISYLPINELPNDIRKDIERYNDLRGDN